MLDKIKKMCKERNISIPKLEDELGLGRGTIYKWESVSPSVVNLKKVADFLGCTLDELANNDS